MLQAEKISAAVAAAVMLLSFFIILFNGWQRLIHPVQMNFNGLIWGVFAAIFSASVNSYLWKRNYKVARLESSPAMEAQWRVFRAKAMINFSVLLTMLINIIYFSNPSVVYVDISVSFLLSLVVLYTAFSNAKIAIQKQENQL
jgi:divalent metal cation (Fe/Co/Zn/Cd) transporter